MYVYIIFVFVLFCTPRTETSQNGVFGKVYTRTAVWYPGCNDLLCWSLRDRYPSNPEYIDYTYSIYTPG